MLSMRLMMEEASLPILSVNITLNSSQSIFHSLSNYTVAENISKYGNESSFYAFSCISDCLNKNGLNYTSAITFVNWTSNPIAKTPQERRVLFDFGGFTLIFFFIFSILVEYYYIFDVEDIPISNRLFADYVDEQMKRRYADFVLKRTPISNYIFNGFIFIFALVTCTGKTPIRYKFLLSS
jgi:hypothetical protein